MEMLARREATLPQQFAGSSRVRGNQARWYLVRTPQGMEQATCNKVKQLVSPALLADAFVMQKEYWFKRDGMWSLQRKPMYKGYFVVATADPAVLDRALARLSFHVRIAGSEQRAYPSMPPQAQAWYEAAMDSEHVVRSSVGLIEGGVLSITSGPLAGQEARVRKIDRRKRWCVVRVGEGEESFNEVLPMDIPIKN